MVEYSFRKLDVWKIGMDLVSDVYRLAATFPDNEKFALISQIKRAAISVPLNIAEGSIKKTKKDFGKFIRTALGSLMEVIACLEIAIQQKYTDRAVIAESEKKAQELYFKLIKLDKFLTGSH